MATNTITFETTGAQNAKIKEAMEWRADRENPANAPHTLSGAQIRASIRTVALQFIKSEVRADLADKRRATAVAGGDDVDDIA